MNKSNSRRAAEQYLLSLLDTCDSIPKLHQAEAHLLKLGLQSNPLVLTKFTSASSSLSSLSSALSLLFSPFSSPHLYDSFLFNTLIRSLAHSPLPSFNLLAISYFSLMLRRRLLPNKFTFPFLLKAIAAAPSPHILGPQAHASAIKFTYADDLFVRNTLIHMYSCCSGGFHSARKVFDGMPKTNVVSWSAMIGGYVRSGLSNEAVVLFREMQVSGVRPDEVTVVAVLSACADLGALELGHWIKSFVERERIPKTLPLCNALLDALAKCGDIDGALKVFVEMPERSIVSWTSVIDGLAMHGRGREAVAVFEEMTSAGVVPDDVAFIGVLSACSHAGMVDEGRRYFASMKSEFNIESKIEHCGCMVDLFSRAGMVEQAMEFVQSMPMRPNPVIWRTLISACRVHGKLELGENITRNLLADEPMHGSNYVLLSNVYALSHRWEKKSEIRKVMSKQGIKKVPGCSLLELDGEIHEFIAGDELHSKYKDVFDMVEEMGRKLKLAGYVPVLSEVLLDIDEEDKEDALHQHSEKLAMAFALLKTAPGTMIRIVKNLRVCADCHSATKFISKVYDRDIIVRDRNRFHHFKDGVCSCGDFW
ncbi:putative tetratricopeptide-like helical domain superfamily, DYW domain-containing protein [Dioscorea sansibarensis]